MGKKNLQKIYKDICSKLTHGGFLTQLKLGKKPKKVDPRTLQAKKYLPPILKAPQEVDWGQKLTKIGDMLNSKYENCAIASAAHMIQIWTSNTGNELTLSDADVLTAYEKLTGFDLSKTTTSSPSVSEIDALHYWRHAGIGNHKLFAFTELEPQNKLQIQYAIHTFGGIYVGIILPASALTQYQTIPQQIWSVVPDNLPSWGGHAVPIIAYDETTLTCITWGIKYKMTWEFFTKYCDEAYAIISNEWIDNNKLSPSGFDLKTLKNDLDIIKNSKSEA